MVLEVSLLMECCKFVMENVFWLLLCSVVFCDGGRFYLFLGIRLRTFKVLSFVVVDGSRVVISRLRKM